MGVTVTCCEDVEKRSTIFSYISGGLLAIAWWIFIEAASTATAIDKDAGIWAHYYIPGIVGTIAFVFLCLLDMATVKGESSDSPGIQLCTKILFFGTMAFVFAAPMFAVWILVSGYAVIEGRAIWPGLTTPASVPTVTAFLLYFTFAGVAVLLQNVLIMISTLLFRFLCVGAHEE